MRLALSIAVMILCGCAETRIYDNGMISEEVEVCNLGAFFFMNLVDPKDIAAALEPLLDTLEFRVTNAVNEAIQSALDRLHGIKITSTVTVDVPPRATAVNEKGNTNG